MGDERHYTAISLATLGLQGGFTANAAKATGGTITREAAIQAIKSELIKQGTIFAINQVVELAEKRMIKNAESDFKDMVHRKLSHLFNRPDFVARLNNILSVDAHHGGVLYSAQLQRCTAQMLGFKYHALQTIFKGVLANQHPVMGAIVAGFNVAEAISRMANVCDDFCDDFENRVIEIERTLPTQAITVQDQPVLREALYHNIVGRITKYMLSQAQSGIVHPIVNLLTHEPIENAAAYVASRMQPPAATFSTSRSVTVIETVVTNPTLSLRAQRSNPESSAGLPRRYAPRNDARLSRDDNGVRDMTDRWLSQPGMKNKAPQVTRWIASANSETRKSMATFSTSSSVKVIDTVITNPQPANQRVIASAAKQSSLGRHPGASQRLESGIHKGWDNGSQVQAYGLSRGDDGVRHQEELKATRQHSKALTQYNPTPRQRDTLSLDLTPSYSVPSKEDWMQFLGSFDSVPKSSNFMDYVKQVGPIIEGVAHHFGKVIEHPYDTLVKPLLNFGADSGTLMLCNAYSALVWDDAKQSYAEMKRSLPQLCRNADVNMQIRGHLVETIARYIANASGPERFRIASQLGIEFAATRKITRFVASESGLVHWTPPQAPKFVRVYDAKSSRWTYVNDGPLQDVTPKALPYFGEPVVARNMHALAVNTKIPAFPGFRPPFGVAVAISATQMPSLYRADSRDPAEIFLIAAGFWARGDDMRLRRHLYPENGTFHPESGYVAASKSKEFTLDFAVNYERKYLYEISPPENSIDMKSALERGRGGYECEVAIPYNIPIENIKGAWRVIDHGYDAPTTGEYILNPYYAPVRILDDARGNARSAVRLSAPSTTVTQSTSLMAPKLHAASSDTKNAAPFRSAFTTSVTKSSAPKTAPKTSKALIQTPIREIIHIGQIHKPTFKVSSEVSHDIRNLQRLQVAQSGLQYLNLLINYAMSMTIRLF